MANSFSKDKMAVLFEELADSTSLNLTLSRDLKTWDMGELANDGRTVENGGTADIVFLPQEYRFTVQDGYESTSADLQDLTDRNIPVRRNKSQMVLAQIKTKDLRDPQRLARARDGIAKDIANAVDTYSYRTMRDWANLTVAIGGDISYEDAILAESEMLNHGLGRYDKKLLLSIPHYNKIAKALQTANRDTAVDGALRRAQVGNLSTFDTMRAEYIDQLAGNTTATLTVNGTQSHTAATYKPDGFFQDNRSMTLSITNATAANFPVGTKFTIAGVNALNPESRTDNGQLQTFTVLSSTTGSAVISPAIVTTGPYRNCTAAAGTGQAIVILNAKNNAASLFYTPESTVLVPGILPVAAEAGGVNTFTGTTSNGLPLRTTMWWDPHGEALNIKTVIFYDVAVLQPNQVGVLLDKQA